MIKRIRRPNFADKALNPIGANIATDSVGLDAFTNAAARMGYATPSLAEATEYELIRWTNDYWLMVTLYRNHWLARRIVDLPAQDMVKAWPKLNCDLKPEEIENFNRTIARTFTANRVKKALTWSRLFGGAGALIVIEGHENILDEPLDLDDVNPGSYKGLIVFDRWSGIYPESNLCNDINSPVDFGQPDYYKVSSETGDGFRVHHSRILRFAGPEVPNPEYAAASYWGISVLELVYEELRKRDNMSWSILQLMFRAQILARKEPDLAQLLSGASSSVSAQNKFAQMMEAQNQLLSNQSMLILGKDSELQSHQYSFGGVSDVYNAIAVIDVSGAADIPASKLFGRTVSGLSNSNETDENNWEQRIAKDQENDMTPNLDKLYPVICMSEFGYVPDDLDFLYPSVRVLTEKDKAELAKNGTEAIMAPFTAGVRGPKGVLKELQSLSKKVDIGSTITDEEVAKASDEVMLPLGIEEAEGRGAGEEFEEESDGEAKPTGKSKKPAKDAKTWLERFFD